MSLWETFFIGFVRFSVPCVREIISCSILGYARNVRVYYLCAARVARVGEGVKRGRFRLQVIGLKWPLLCTIE